MKIRLCKRLSDDTAHEIRLQPATETIVERGHVLFGTINFCLNFDEEKPDFPDFHSSPPGTSTCTPFKIFNVFFFNFDKLCMFRFNI
jgi:hypothetical protein